MKILDVNTFKKMLINGCNSLANDKDLIDALNVFPVPDGDTGTNMTLTINSGKAAIINSEFEDIATLTKTFSKALLMGARGNSGVITSQIFRGLAISLENKKNATIEDLQKAFVSSYKTAYSQVMRPVEGTILTVAREAGENISTKKYENINDLFDDLVTEAQISLDNTPNLLPVLKEVGVVDSGGTGLLRIYQGFKKHLDGETIEYLESSNKSVNVQANMESEEFGYCTEFIVTLEEHKIPTFNIEILKSELSKIGDSIVAVHDEEIIKVHIHTLKPGKALNIGQKYGEFTKLKIENMQIQHEEIMGLYDSKKQEKIKKETIIISVATGDGISKAFYEYGADHVVVGGQTMNPSTEDFLSVFEKFECENVIILPNNSNIIMAALQVKQVSTLNIEVIETRSIPEGISALAIYNSGESLEKNSKKMREILKHVKSASITYASRDTKINNLEIKADNYIAILGKEIVATNSNQFQTLKELFTKMITQEDELLTIYVGEDTTDENTDNLVNFLQENYELEIEIINGQQPLYSYLFGLE